MNKVVIFGGTFNPIHNGHIFCANECVRKLKCDKLIFVPSNIPPHKVVDSRGALPYDRFEMCKIAAEDNNKFEVSDFEIKRDKVSYTVDTLEYFKKLMKGSELFLLVGEDMFDTLLSWKNPDRIFKFASICVAERYKSKQGLGLDYIKTLKKRGANLVFLNLKPFEMSSTFIRERIKAGDEAIEYVPHGVGEYIAQNKLYKKN